VYVPLQAELRSDFGKGAARKLRLTGRIPAVMYSGGSEVVHVSVPEHELTLALRKPSVTLEIVVDGAKTLTKPRDVQRDPVRRNIEHIDLIVIDDTEAKKRVQRSAAMAAEAEAAAAAAESAPEFSGSYATEGSLEDEGVQVAADNQSADGEAS
jgi:large subunit ribosomal protein L25